jgi:hypothetical protein
MSSRVMVVESSRVTAMVLLLMLFTKELHINTI